MHPSLTGLVSTLVTDRSAAACTRHSARQTIKCDLLGRCTTAIHVAAHVLPAYCWPSRAPLQILGPRRFCYSHPICYDFWLSRSMSSRSKTCLVCVWPRNAPTTTTTQPGLQHTHTTTHNFGHPRVSAPLLTTSMHYAPPLYPVSTRPWCEYGTVCRVCKTRMTRHGHVLTIGDIGHRLRSIVHWASIIIIFCLLRYCYCYCYNKYN